MSKKRTGLSVAKMTREILEKNPSLVHELQQRKTPQRAIAKQIKDILLEKGVFMDKDPNKLEGNIAVCITRHLKRLREKQEDLLGIKRVQSILKMGTTEITDGLKHYKIQYVNGTDITLVLNFLSEKIEQKEICSGQLHSHGLECYVKKMFEQKFIEGLNQLEGVNYIKLQDYLSLLKLMLPHEAAEVPGILAHISSLLADQAISIYDTQIFHTDHLVITFVVKESSASQARDILMKVIKKMEN